MNRKHNKLTRRRDKLIGEADELRDSYETAMRRPLGDPSTELHKMRRRVEHMNDQIDAHEAILEHIEAERGVDAKHEQYQRTIKYSDYDPMFRQYWNRRVEELDRIVELNAEIDAINAQLEVENLREFEQQLSWQLGVAPGQNGLAPVPAADKLLVVERQLTEARQAREQAANPTARARWDQHVAALEAERDRLTPKPEVGYVPEEDVRYREWIVENRDDLAKVERTRERIAEIERRHPHLAADPTEAKLDRLREQDTWQLVSQRETTFEALRQAQAENDEKAILENQERLDAINQRLREVRAAQRDRSAGIDL